MFKKCEDDLIVADIKVYFDFFSGTRVKVLCRKMSDTSTCVYDFPIHKLHVCDVRYDAIACRRFGLLRRFYISSEVFGSIRFKRRK